MSKPQMSAFAKAMRRSYNSSIGGTKGAERVNIVQSPDLRPFTPSERTGQPLKAGELRA